MMVTMVMMVMMVVMVMMVMMVVMVMTVVTVMKTMTTWGSDNTAALSDTITSDALTQASQCEKENCTSVPALPSGTEFLWMEFNF